MEVLNETNAPPLAKDIAEAIRSNRIDDAEQLLEQLYLADPKSRELLIFPAIIAIQRGRVLEVLQYINGLPEDRCPEIKALCLKIVGDPLWQGCAESLLDNPDPFVRKAMRELLDMAPEEDGSA